MGCNAWNHSFDCNCGWGGDTGGGHHGTSLFSDGKTWLYPTHLKYESFVNPNALCPICGAEVFFYSSRFGGRVFFDSLGPPWPKHPCTDAYLRRPNALPRRVLKLSKAVPARLDGWHPLIPLEITTVGGKDRITLAKTANRLPSRYIYLPILFANFGPCYWRRNPADPTLIEVSNILVGNQGQVQEGRCQIPNWIRNDEHLASFKQGDEPDKLALAAIGWSLSFAWKTDDPNWREASAVDLGLAQVYFLTAAEQDLWSAWNNLGVMARDGLGAAPDSAYAFECFSKAAQSKQPVSIRHLARCYREAIGVAADVNHAASLEKLALSLEAGEMPMH